MWCRKSCFNTPVAQIPGHTFVIIRQNRVKPQAGSRTQPQSYSFLSPVSHSSYQNPFPVSCSEEKTNPYKPREEGGGQNSRKYATNAIGRKSARNLSKWIGRELVAEASAFFIRPVFFSQPPFIAPVSRGSFFFISCRSNF